MGEQMGEHEQRLAGGVTGAVRVGDTIRKPSGPWTPTVQAMLRHLRDAGVETVPEPLGLDDRGRESMSFIPGTVATRPWPARLLTLDGVADLAAWTRRFHDAIVGFRPEDPVWRAGRLPIAEGQIALHGDLGPWNSVWDGDRFVGIIDWDLAEPGPPIADLAFLALQVVPLRADRCARDAGFDGNVPRGARLRTLCETYGGPTPQDVVDEVARIIERDLARERTWGPLGREPWATFRARGDERILLEDRAWLDAHAATLFAGT